VNFFHLLYLFQLGLKQMGADGFEPPKDNVRQIYSLMQLAALPHPHYIPFRCFEKGQEI
jgi:hypothetical protein